jgi:spore maturation protein CgeB
MSGLRVAVLGLSLSSSWGNGHATTYRALLKAFAARGHDIVFYERDQPWYAAHRDLVEPSYCRLVLYDGLASLSRHRRDIAAADAVIVGSYVPEGVALGKWVLDAARGRRAFYDIDTPVTLAKLAAGDCEYVSPELIRAYELYLSFSGGPALDVVMREYGSPDARPLYCSVDPEAYRPSRGKRIYDLGYLGTYSDDRQPTLERLLLEPARRAPHLRFVVAGPLYPESIAWPANVAHIDHVPPAEHARFYGSCRFTLNVTRQDMVRLGYSPSVRLFEAAACGVPIISDAWCGLDAFLEPGREIALAEKPEDVLAILAWDEERAGEFAARSRRRVLAGHTAAHRAKELESYLTAPVASRTCREAAATASLATA